MLALAESLDHVGPMARSVVDAVALYNGIAGYDENDQTSLNLEDAQIAQPAATNLTGLRLGVDADWFSHGTDPGLLASLEQAIDVFTALGMEWVPVEMPREGPMDYRNLWLPLTGYEAYRAHRETFPAREADYGGYLANVLRMGMMMTEEEYAAAAEQRSEFSARFEAALSEVDAVICPSGGMVFAVNAHAQQGDAEAMKEVVKHFQGQFTIPADLAGTPTLSLPCGFNDQQQPYVMQLMGANSPKPRSAKLAMPISRKPTGITAILITDTGLMGANLRLAWASDDEPAACGLPAEPAGFTAGDQPLAPPR